MSLELPVGETNWGEELKSLVEDLNNFISVAKLKIEALPAETAEAWIEAGQMQKTDIGIVVGTQLDGPPSYDQLSQLVKYCEQLESMSVQLEVLKTSNEYAIVVIKPIVN